MQTTAKAVESNTQEVEDDTFLIQTVTNSVMDVRRRANVH
jgi:hypothetical protein